LAKAYTLFSTHIFPTASMRILSPPQSLSKSSAPQKMRS